MIGVGSLLEDAGIALVDAGVRVLPKRVVETHPAFDSNGSIDARVA